MEKYELIKNGYEIERRFLVDINFDLSKFDSKNIVQYYLNDNVTRLRRIENSFILTQKSGSGIKRTEIEYEITKDQFDKLKKGAKSVLFKTRYYIPLYDNLIAEIDFYKKELEGIIVCEVEFPSITSASNFIVPSWFTKEITGDKNMSNKKLSQDYKKAINYFNKIKN